MLTIRSLLDVSSLGLRVLVDGERDATEAALLWVHNTELLDPSAYLRERELVLTNGLWHDGANADTFVANVLRAGGAGIMYGLRDVTPRTPQDLTEACARRGMPLLELPVEVPFTDVTRAAAAELAERRQETLADMVRRGNALADAISQGSGASGVLRILRRDHHLPLAVVDRTGHVLAAAGASISAEGTAAVVQALKRHPPPLEVELGGTDRAAVFLVMALGAIDAALLCLRPLDELSSVEHDALTQAAHYLSLEVARIQLAQAMEARFAGELLEMIASGSPTAAEAGPRLEAFGIDPASSMLVIAAALTRADVAAHADLATCMGEFFPREGLPALVANGTHDVVAIVAWNRPIEQATELTERMLAVARRRLPGLRVVAGHSGPARALAELRRPVREAREACRVLRRRPGGPELARFGDLDTFHLLLGGQDHDSVRRLAEGVLGPVREYDARQGGNIETTVRRFLDHDGQWAATAAELYIHVNTLRNRLAKLAELTGRDVTTTEGRVDVFLALEADAMLRSAE